METFYWYKDFGIRYSGISGDTRVEDIGYVLKTFYGKGCHYGEDLAKKYIDSLTK